MDKRFKEALSERLIDEKDQEQLLVDTPDHVINRLVDRGDLVYPRRPDEYVIDLELVSTNDIKVKDHEEALYIALYIDMKSASPEWFAAFMNYGGPEKMIPIIHRLGCNIYKSDAEWRYLRLLLTCVRLMMTTHDDIILLLRIPLFPKAMLASFQPRTLGWSSSEFCNEISLAILIVLTRLSAKSAQAVFDALDERRDDELAPSSLSFIIDAIRSDSISLNLVGNCLALINTIVSIPDTVELRAELRSDLQDEGFDEDIDKIQQSCGDNDRISKQLYIFYENAVCDDFELARLQLTNVITLGPKPDNSENADERPLSKWTMKHLLSKARYVCGNFNDIVGVKENAMSEQLCFIKSLSLLGVDLLGSLSHWAEPNDDDNGESDICSSRSEGDSSSVTMNEKRRNSEILAFERFIESSERYSPRVLQNQSSPVGYFFSSTALSPLLTPESLSSLKINSVDATLATVSHVSVSPTPAAFFPPPPPPPPSGAKFLFLNVAHGVIAVNLLTKKIPAIKMVEQKATENSIFHYNDDKSFKIDEESFINTFGRIKVTKSQRDLIESATAKSPENKKKAFVSVLPSAIARIVDIFLGCFGGSAPALECIYKLDISKCSSSFTSGLVSLISKIPESSVISKISAIIEKDGGENVAASDLFLLCLSHITDVRHRMDCVFKCLNYAESAAFIKNRLSKFMDVCKEVNNSRRLIKIIQALLQYINVANASNGLPRLKGYQFLSFEAGTWVCSLSRLGAIKATKEAMSVLEHAAAAVIKAFPDSFNIAGDFPNLKSFIFDKSFYDDTCNLLTSLEADITALKHSVNPESSDYVHPLSQLDTGPDPYHAFVEHHITLASELSLDCQRMFIDANEMFQSTIVYLNGEADRILWEEFFSPLKLWIFEEWTNAVTKMVRLKRKQIKTIAATALRSATSSPTLAPSVSHHVSRPVSRPVRRRRSIISVTTATSDRVSDRQNVAANDQVKRLLGGRGDTFNAAISAEDTEGHVMYDRVRDGFRRGTQLWEKTESSLNIGRFEQKIPKVLPLDDSTAQKPYTSFPHKLSSYSPQSVASSQDMLKSLSKVASGISLDNPPAEDRRTELMPLPATTSRPGNLQTRTSFIKLENEEKDSGGNPMAHSQYQRPLSSHSSVDEQSSNRSEEGDDQLNMLPLIKQSKSGRSVAMASPRLQVSALMRSSCFTSNKE